MNYTPPVGFRFEVRLVERINRGDFSNLQSLASAASALDGSFQDVAGISMEIPTKEYWAGGENRFPYRLPEPARYSNLVLKRGLVTNASGLYEWCRQTFSKNLSGIQTKIVVVTLMNDINLPLIAWYFEHAYPVKWEISNLNAMDNKVVVETLELVYQKFTSIPLSNFTEVEQGFGLNSASLPGFG